MRAEFTQTVGGEVVAQWDDFLTGERITRVYSVVSGDVRRVHSNGTNSFVGERLSAQGWCLYAKIGTLLSVVRREYRAMRRAEGR